METASVLSRHDEKNDTSIQAILKDCIGTLIKDFLYLNQKVLICLPTEACLPDFLVDIEEIFGCSDSDTVSDVVVLHNVRSIESCSKIQKALLENQSKELFCYLTQTIGRMKAISSLLS